jgi:crotonobetainyl-CoA:carnitine CoA-transferase CaiB-like acyl-CoA transferase
MVGKPVYDPAPAAMTGVAARQGGGCLPPGREVTMRLPEEEIKEYSRRIGLTSEGVVDAAGALTAATAVLYGLLNRTRTGHGCVLETTMLAATLYANSEAYDKRLPGVASLQCNGLGLSPLYRFYEVRDGWVFLACGDEGAWQALHRSFLTGTVAGMAFAEAWRSEQLSQQLEEAFKGYNAKDLERRCLAAGIPCVAALPARTEILQEPWMRQSGLLTTTSDGVLGTYSRCGALSGPAGAPAPAGGAPLLGEHTALVLHELGYSDAEIQAAIERRDVRCASPTSIQSSG